MTIVIGARLPDGNRRSLTVERDQLVRVAGAGDVGRMTALANEVVRQIEAAGLEPSAGERQRLAVALSIYTGDRLEVEVACTPVASSAPPPDALVRTLKEPAAWLRYPEQSAEWLQRVKTVGAGLGYTVYCWRVGRGFSPSLPGAPNTLEPKPALDGATAFVQRGLNGAASVLLVFQNLDFREAAVLGRRDDVRAAMQSLIDAISGRLNVHVAVLNSHDEVPPELTGQFAVMRLPSTRSATPVLDKLCEDLTRKALTGQIARMVGNDRQIRQILRVLNVIAGQPNNVVVLGEAGVGKTAIVEEIARRIAFGNVPARLRGRRVLKLRANDLTADTSLAGSLEARVRDLIDEVRRNRDTIILFIDEVHALFQQGGRGAPIVQALKEGWARGELPTIGATTLAEVFALEADPAVQSRFRRVLVERPDPDLVLQILMDYGPRLEERHKLRILPEAYVEARDGASRYMADEAPPRAPLRLLASAASRAEMEERDTLDADLVQQEIEEITRIPVRPPAPAEQQELMGLEATIERTLHGQTSAIAIMASLVRGRRLRPPRVPIPLVLLVFGPSGTGKSETGNVFQKYVCDPSLEPIVFRLNEIVSEFQVTSLVGAPPGYVGYDQGAQLVERIAGRPHSVVVFDEIEKTHPRVADALLQILETGIYVDPRGRRGDYRSAIVIITSNLLDGGEAVGKSAADVRRMVVEAFAQPRSIGQPGVGPAFVGRCQVLLPFEPLDREACEQIATDRLTQLVERLGREYDLRAIDLEQGIAQRLVASRYDERTNARPITYAVGEVAAVASGIVQNDASRGRLLLDWRGDAPSVRFEP